MFEIAAVFFGTLTVLLFLFISYCYRHTFVDFVDSFTSLSWVSANFLWMIGEIFLRYENLTLDDKNQGDDTIFRVCALVFFIFGLICQVVVIFYIKIIISEKYKHAKYDIIFEKMSNPFSFDY